MLFGLGCMNFKILLLKILMLMQIIIPKEEGHIKSLCKKASQKLHALARIVNYMDLPKRKVFMKALITSQFSYCPLTWKLHSWTLNKHTNNIHETGLRLTYKANQSLFKELLEKDHSVTVYHKNF